MPTGRRRAFIIALAVVVGVLVLFSVFSGFFIDLLWYREVGLSSVFLKVLGTKSLLGLVFGLVFFGLLYVNLLIVRRLKPPFHAVSLEQEMIERYRVALEPSLRWLLPLLAGVLALFVGIGAASQWHAFLLVAQLVGRVVRTARSPVSSRRRLLRLQPPLVAFRAGMAVLGARRA